ncbi:HTH-type transcriptional regulator BetI [compost metagenome]
MAAAEDAFAAQGFHGASLSAIARIAGLSNPGLIHHYPTKAALYLALLDLVGGELVERVTTALVEVAGPRERLRALMAALATWTIQRPPAVRLILRELIDNVERVDAAETLPLTHLVKILTREFSAAQNKGLLPVGPPLAFLTQVLGTLAYALVVRPTFHRMQLDEPLLSEDESWIQKITETLFQTLIRDDS